MHVLAIVVYMLAAHALLDYALQGDWLSKAKNPSLDLVPGETIWPLALASHALIHAVGVQLITGSWLLCLVEFSLHFLIDGAKCRGRFGYNADQLMHIGCKLFYGLLLLLLGPLP